MFGKNSIFSWVVYYSYFLILVSIKHYSHHQSILTKCQNLCSDTIIVTPTSNTPFNCIHGSVFKKNNFTIHVYATIHVYVLYTIHAYGSHLKIKYMTVVKSLIPSDLLVLVHLCSWVSYPICKLVHPNIYTGGGRGNMGLLVSFLTYLTAVNIWERAGAQ